MPVRTMRSFNSIKCAFGICAALCVCAVAAETPRIAARPTPLGPVVDVTLRNGESSKGELLSFADGVLKLKLDNGNVVTQDRADVVSVRFTSPEKPTKMAPVLSAQETELTVGEIDQLIVYRRRDGGFKGPFADKQPLLPLTKAEQGDFDRLRAKTDLHVKALEAEIPSVMTEEAAQARLNELGRYYFLYGQYALNDIRAYLKRAAMSIHNPAVRSKFDDAAFGQFWQSFIDKHENRFNKVHEKALERNMLDKIDKTTPPPPQKPLAPKD